MTFRRISRNRISRSNCARWGDISVMNPGRSRRAARDLGAHRLARPAARVDRREVAADEHDVARPANGVADPERDHVLLVAGALVHDPGGVLPEEAHPRIPGVRIHESALALHLDVLADDLDQVLARVLQVQGRAGELQAQRIAEESPLEHSLRIETKILTWLLIACRSPPARCPPARSASSCDRPTAAPRCRSGRLLGSPRNTRRCCR